MFGCVVEKHGQNSHLRQRGKIAELALGYGGSVGALKAMGATDMGIPEEELQPLVDMWRSSNPHITQYWWAVDAAVKEAISLRTETRVGDITFVMRNGMLFITLPSGRRLSYVKPRLGENRFGGESVTYMGIDATKHWSRIESYGPKFVENIVKAVSRDILAYAMRTLSYCQIVGHVHDELIIECSPDVSLDAICEQMGRTPWPRRWATSCFWPFSTRRSNWTPSTGTRSKASSEKTSKETTRWWRNPSACCYSGIIRMTVYRNVCATKTSRGTVTAESSVLRQTVITLNS